MTRLTKFFDFIRERDLIRLKREAGQPAPWTKDPILRKYRFCNVRRKHDRVSQWMIKHVLTEENIEADLGLFIEFSTLARFVNWPPTLKEIWEHGYWRQGEQHLPWKDIGKLLDRRHATGEKTWTGAYMIKGKPEGKGKYITRVLGQGFKKERGNIMLALTNRNLSDAHEALQALPECGRFLAGQVVADWTYTSLLDHAEDLMTWAPLGPGSRRGYNRILNNPLKQWPKPDVFVAQLINWHEEMIKYLGTTFADMTLHDLQNCLCEHDKSERVRLGEGEPRSLYRPETRY